MNIRRITPLILSIAVNLFYGYGLERLYPVKVLLDILTAHFKKTNSRVIIQGHTMFLDSKDSLGLSVWGIHEPLVTKIFKKEIRSGYVVLDIGAHIGYYTLIAAKLVGKNGKVFAFEPDPTNFTLLKENIITNSYKNVVIAQKAVTNKSGKLKLYLSEDSSGHRICDSHDGRRAIEIESVQLDDYFRNHDGHIDFIKMDVEGAEYNAIQGMLLLLKKNRNLKIVTEFYPEGLERFGTEPKKLLELIVKKAYRTSNDQ
jgi:FkbM family methyltransferase